MCPESYSWEIREAAEELYIIDGHTYEQVAEATGVSISQLKRWGMDSTTSYLDKSQLNNFADEIWKSAERLRSKIKANEYQIVILSIITFRRLECVLFAKIRSLTYRYLRDNTLFPVEITQYDTWITRCLQMGWRRSPGTSHL
jgi:hypothetical protein